MDTWLGTRLTITSLSSCAGGNCRSMQPNSFDELRGACKVVVSSRWFRLLAGLILASACRPTFLKALRFSPRSRKSAFHFIVALQFCSDVLSALPQVMIKPLLCRMMPVVILAAIQQLHVKAETKDQGAHCLVIVWPFCNIHAHDRVMKSSPVQLMCERLLRREWRARGRSYRTPCGR